MQNKLSKRLWFTLIELIVVIAIISILAIASIVVVNKWVLKSKNATRLADAETIAKNLDSVFVNYGYYPNPTDKIDILDTGDTVIAFQWFFGTGILDSWSFINNIPVDPSTKTHYTYTKILNPKPWFEVWVVLEESQVSLINQSVYAVSNRFFPFIITQIWFWKINMA